jgi:hypothetical protein
MRDIIYFNGDSWTDSFVFKRASKQVLSSDFMIINQATSGNWNKVIIDETVSDLTYLSNIAPNVNIHAFVFLSEWLRSSNELDLMKILINQTGVNEGINSVISKLATIQVNAFRNKISTLPNVKLHLSTAFIDAGWGEDMKPMYKMIMDGLNLQTHQAICYNVSYVNKFGDSELRQLGFNTYQIDEFVNNSLIRCLDLESIPKIIKYHISAQEQYNIVIEEIQQLL